MKTLLGFSLLVLYTFSALAWGDVDLTQLGHRIEQSGYRGDTGDLQAAHDLLKTEIDQQPDKYRYYYLGYTDYVLARLVAHDDSDRATQLVHEAQQSLLEAIKLDAGFAEAEALLGSSYGLEIGLHPFSGMWLGHKTKAHTDRSWQLAPDDPRVILLRAISDFSTPALFGGDQKRALQGFHMALTAFESRRNGDAAAPDWGRAETYQWLGLAESRAGDTEDARKDYGKALELAPDYKLAQKRLAALPSAPRTSAGPTIK